MDQSLLLQLIQSQQHVIFTKLFTQLNRERSLIMMQLRSQFVNFQVVQPTMSFLKLHSCKEQFDILAKMIEINQRSSSKRSQSTQQKHMDVRQLQNSLTSSPQQSIMRNNLQSLLILAEKSSVKTQSTIPKDSQLWEVKIFHSTCSRFLVVSSS